MACLTTNAKRGVKRKVDDIQDSQMIQKNVVEFTGSLQSDENSHDAIINRNQNDKSTITSEVKSMITSSTTAENVIVKGASDSYLISDKLTVSHLLTIGKHSSSVTDSDYCISLQNIMSNTSLPEPVGDGSGQTNFKLTNSPIESPTASDLLTNSTCHSTSRVPQLNDYDSLDNTNKPATGLENSSEIRNKVNDENHNSDSPADHNEVETPDRNFCKNTIKVCKNTVTTSSNSSSTTTSLTSSTCTTVNNNNNNANNYSNNSSSSNTRSILSDNNNLPKHSPSKGHPRASLSQNRKGNSHKTGKQLSI